MDDLKRYRDHAGNLRCYKCDAFDSEGCEHLAEPPTAAERINRAEKVAALGMGDPDTKRIWVALAHGSRTVLCGHHADEEGWRVGAVGVVSMACDQDLDCVSCAVEMGWDGRDDWGSWS